MTRPPTRTIPGSAGQRGIALFEAMIAILLLSLCALAYASVQMRSLSNNASALWRGKAVQMTQEMGDRMRANRVGLTAGAYNSLLAPGTAPGCGSSSSCTPAQTAALDYTNWSTTVANELPGGSGVVCIDSSPDDGTAAAPACDGLGSTFAVKVFWNERGTASRVAVGLRP